MYFQFNPQNFTSEQLVQLNSEIEQSNRRLVVIIDPHIKQTDDYFVYKNGMLLQNAPQ